VGTHGTTAGFRCGGVLPHEHGVVTKRNNARSAPTLIAAIPLAFLHDRPCLRSAIGGQRAADAALPAREFSFVAANIPLVTLMRLDQLAWHCQISLVSSPNIPFGGKVPGAAVATGRRQLPMMGYGSAPSSSRGRPGVIPQMIVVESGQPQCDRFDMCDAALRRRCRPSAHTRSRRPAHAYFWYLSRTFCRSEADSTHSSQ
jgi:hypothetical protein